MYLLLTIAIFCESDGFKHLRTIRAPESYVMKVVHDYEVRPSFRDCIVTLTMAPSKEKSKEKPRKGK